MDENNETVTTTEPSRPSLGGERLQIGSVLLAVAFIFLFTAVTQVILDAIISAVAPALAAADWYGWMLAAVPMYLVAMPLSLILFLLGRSTPPQKKEPLSLPMMLGLVAICFALTYLGSFLGAAVNVIIGAITGKMPENSLNTMTASAPLWANLLFVGILAPVMEEIFFRKLVIDRLRRYGDAFAMLSSGVIFGLIHGNFYQFFYATAMGIIFGYIYLRTGRIRDTILLHTSINLVGGVYTSEMLKLLDEALLEQNPVAAMLESPAGALMLSLYLSFVLLCLIGAVAAAIPLYRHWIREHRFAPAARKLDAREWVRVTLCNPAIYVFLVFVIFMFL